MKGLRTMTATGHPVAHPTGFDLTCGDHYFSALPFVEGVIRLDWTIGEAPPATPAVVAKQDRSTQFDVRELLDGWRVSVPGLSMRVRIEPLSYWWRLPTGEALAGPVMVGQRDGKLLLASPLAADDAFFGLGDKPGFLDRRGRRYTMWCTDNPGPHNETDEALYQAIPFVITRHAGRFCGFFVEDTGRVAFDLGAKNHDGWHIEVDGPTLRLWVLAGPTLGEVLRRYAALTGTMPLPPRWALGYHQSRWGYQSQNEIEGLAAQFRHRQIPIDAFHLDIDHMDRYKVFTWHPQRFSDPAGMHRRLLAQGVRTVAIADPGIKKERGYAAYDSLLGSNLAVRDRDGMPFIGPVWPGDCLFPDFLRPEGRIWWATQHAPYFQAGVSGIWCDMNEPSVFVKDGGLRPDGSLAPVSHSHRTMPDDAQHGPPGAPMFHRQAHNVYGLHMAEATRAAWQQHRPEARPFVLSRAGWAGIQRHAAIWTGDNHATWHHLEQSLASCLSLSLSGVPFVGSDVGGFAGDTTGELLVRWTQAAALTPFFRNHSAKGTKQQEPWQFGPEVERRVREAIALRYRLLPYLYTVFQAATQTGLPVMRPMMLDYGHDPASHGLADQFLVGGDVLVAPVLRPGASVRLVWFPPGAWYDFHTGKPVVGSGFQPIETPIDRVPLFIRSGAVLPVGPVVAHTGISVDALDLFVYPPRAGQAPVALQGALYDDDGESHAYTQGGFTQWQWHGYADTTTVTLTQSGETNGYAGALSTVRIVLPSGYTLGCDWEEAKQPNDEATDLLGKLIITWNDAVIVGETGPGGHLMITLPLKPGTLRIASA